jgi:hypothetical protein
VNCTLFFYNGQAPLTISAFGLFNMFRPQATVTTTTGTVAVDTNYSGYAFALHYGNNVMDYAETNVGILFIPTITIPDGFSGYTEWVQVLNCSSGQTEFPDHSWSPLNTIYNVLDGNDPYPNAPFDDSTTTADSPGIAGVDYDLVLTRDFDASMWLMFTPDGGHRVPLNRVDWHWSGAATNTGTSWSLTSDHNAKPSGTDT